MDLGAIRRQATAALAHFGRDRGGAVSVRCYDEGLRDHIPSIHQLRCHLAVHPTEPETKMEITRELLHAVRCCMRVFCRQAYKPYVAASILSAHFLVLWNFSAARAAPGRP